MITLTGRILTIVQDYTHTIQVLLVFLMGCKFTWKVPWSMGWDGLLQNLTEGIFELLAGTSNYDLFILNDKNSRKKKPKQNAWTAESFIPAHWLLCVCAYVTNIPTLLLLLDLARLKKICKSLFCKILRFTTNILNGKKVEYYYTKSG